MNKLYHNIRSCTICKEHLPLEPNPILSFTKNSKIVLVSQAPGLKAHQSTIPYKDPSGKTLRKWLGVTESEFYNPNNFAILPMGFCYPGKAKNGDLPPRPECAPQWHQDIWDYLENVKLTILIGRYAQASYLKNRGFKTLTENVKHRNNFLPQYFPIPHPSPLNRRWLVRNEWFEDEVVTELKVLINDLLHLN